MHKQFALRKPDRRGAPFVSSYEPCRPESRCQTGGQVSSDFTSVPPMIVVPRSAEVLESMLSSEARDRSFTIDGTNWRAKDKTRRERCADAYRREHRDSTISNQLILGNAMTRTFHEPRTRERGCLTRSERCQRHAGEVSLLSVFEKVQKPFNPKTRAASQDNEPGPRDSSAQACRNVLADKKSVRNPVGCASGGSLDACELPLDCRL